jgi:hypothetical protein
MPIILQILLGSFAIVFGVYFVVQVFVPRLRLPWRGTSIKAGPVSCIGFALVFITAGLDSVFLDYSQRIFVTTTSVALALGILCVVGGSALDYFRGTRGREKAGIVGVSTIKTDRQKSQKLGQLFQLLAFIGFLLAVASWPYHYHLRTTSPQTPDDVYCVYLCDHSYVFYVKPSQYLIYHYLQFVGAILFFGLGLTGHYLRGTLLTRRASNCQEANGQEGQPSDEPNGAPPRRLS